LVPWSRRRGTVAEVAAIFEVREPRGEFVVLVGAPAAGSELQSGPEEMEEAARQLLRDGLSLSQVAKSVARQLGVSKNAAYDAARRVQEEEGGRGEPPHVPQP
jgi:16S rRNA C1402 (ribose-2'-O) methylase RsmI